MQRSGGANLDFLVVEAGDLLLVGSQWNYIGSQWDYIGIYRKHIGKYKKMVPKIDFVLEIALKGRLCFRNSSQTLFKFGNREMKPAPPTTYVFNGHAASCCRPVSLSLSLSLSF